MATQMRTIVHEGKADLKDEPKVKKAAAYCRVSTLSSEQELSYESQCEYFAKMIAEREDLALVGIYGDHGFSGLHADKRPGLQKMLAAARDGRIDVILTKSISRLARNMMELQEIVEEMNDLGVDIEFEREGIHSNDPQFEIVLKFLAAVAQEEVNSISQAIKWSYDNNIKNGNPTQNCSYGFRKKPRKKGDPHVWEIYEPEAKLVRTAYDLAASGMSKKDIAKFLNEEQKRYPDAKQRKWGEVGVYNLLKNVTNVGDILTHKHYTPDYISGKRAVNHGERDQYYLEDHHPAIVSREIFEKVNGKKGD